MLKSINVDKTWQLFGGNIYRVIKSLCAPDDYSTKNRQKYYKQFQSLTMLTYLELVITYGVSVSLVSVNVWRLAGDTLNITCNILYCNYEVHREFLITLYNLGVLCCLLCAVRK
jgi:hypothetical protein